MRETLPPAGCPDPLQLPSREPSGSKNEVRPGKRRASKAVRPGEGAAPQWAVFPFKIRLSPSKPGAVASALEPPPLPFLELLLPN